MFKTLIVGDGYDVTSNGIVVDNLVVRNTYNGVPIDTTPEEVHG
jgi:hypothetical protein